MPDLLVTSRALFLASVFLACPAVAQGGDLVAPPRGLTVVFVDVGQGDGTILVGPTGTVMVVDGGFDGQGHAAMVPALERLGVQHITYMLATHFDPDHIGGLDDVHAVMSVLSVWDRGTVSVPSHRQYRDYVEATGSKRRPASIGQIFDLGGGAKAQVLAVDGNVLSRGTLPIRTRSQPENAASIGLKVTYGDFAMWLGGDLTGGGNGTYDVESVVAPVCGDVDVYQVNHHGSNTSTNSALVSYLDPEVAIASLDELMPSPFRFGSTPSDG